MIWNLGGTEPIIPSPTPAPPPSEVLSTLEELGIVPGSGFVAETVDRVILDVTVWDNFIETEYVGAYDDFILESDITWGPGDAQDFCGIILRSRSGPDYYYVTLNQEKRVGVLDVGENRLRDIVYYDSPMLREGEGETNTLRVVAAGEMLTLYVNGLYLAQYSGMEVVEGSLLLAAENSVGSEVSFCTFENVWVWDLAFEAPVILTPKPTPTVTPTQTPTRTPTATQPPDV